MNMATRVRFRELRIAKLTRFAADFRAEGNEQAARRCDAVIAEDQAKLTQLQTIAARANLVGGARNA